MLAKDINAMILKQDFYFKAIFIHDFGKKCKISVFNFFPQGMKLTNNI